MLQAGPVLPEFPGALCLVMDFAGMDTPSSQVVDYLREYAPGVKEVTNTAK